jgi:hypothetical protein
MPRANLYAAVVAAALRQASRYPIDMGSTIAVSVQKTAAAVR